MISRDYQNISTYLKAGDIPGQLTSTVGNFKKKANKFQLNKKGQLTRNGKVVIRYSERASIFQTFHQVLF